VADHHADHRHEVQLTDQHLEHRKRMGDGMAAVWSPNAVVVNAVNE
jgi:hypothetical protein